MWFQNHLGAQCIGIVSVYFILPVCVLSTEGGSGDGGVMVE